MKMSQIYVMRCFLINRSAFKSSPGILRQIKQLNNGWSVWRWNSTSSTSGPGREGSNRYLEVKNRRSAAEQSAVSADVRPLGEKIKENTKTVTYLTVILLGIGVTAVMMWSIGQELLSSTSPNGVYSAAFERVKGVNEPTM